MIPKRFMLRDILGGKIKESTIPMCKYTSQYGEHKAYLEWSGLVWWGQKQVR
jgi:hypothetical protein